MIIIIFILMIGYFRQYFHRILINLIYLIYLFCVLANSIGSTDYNVFFFIFLGCLFMYMTGRNVFKIVTNMDSSLKDNNKFKYIFDNLDESIIIIQDKKQQIDYVNNKFLMEFDSEII